MTDRDMPQVKRWEFENLWRGFRQLEASVEWISDRENILAHEIDKLIDKVEALDSEVRHLMAKDQAPMKAQPDSDGWIPHDGGRCPVGPSAVVEYKLRGDQGYNIPPRKSNAGALVWSNVKGAPGSSDIIAYRPAKQEPPTVRFEEKARRQGKSWAYNMYMKAQQQEAEWPQQYDHYWCFDDRGRIIGPVKWTDHIIDRQRRDSLGIYPTREAAEEAAAKIKRVMEHWRGGGSVSLVDEESLYAGERIKL